MAFISWDPDEAEEVLANSTIKLMAEFIIFSVDPSSQFAGNATITANTLNVGDNFQSGAGQQSLLLYEKSLGTPSNQPGDLVGQLDFTSLAAGEKT